MNEKEITLERVIDAPVEKVWNAWTDERQVAAWWGPKGVSIPECAVDARVDGALKIVMLAGEELGLWQVSAGRCRAFSLK
ncbi:MAG: SRPBCC family protein [Minisyncoccia bacterium]